MSNDKMQLQKYKQNLREESQEIFRLKRELQKANSKIKTQQSTLNELKHVDDKKVPGFFRNQIAAQKNFKENSYFKYLLSSIKSNTYYGVGEKVFVISKRFRLVSRLFKTISYIVLIIETSTAFILIATILAAFLVPLLIATGIVYIVSVIRRKKKNVEMRNALFNKKVCVFMPGKNTSFNNYSYFKFMVESYAEKENCMSVVISPFFWSSVGFYRKTFYLMGRRECKNVYFIRKHYFFSLKKHVLNSAPVQITYVY